MSPNVPESPIPHSARFDGDRRVEAGSTQDFPEYVPLPSQRHRGLIVAGVVASVVLVAAVVAVVAFTAGNQAADRSAVEDQVSGWIADVIDGDAESARARLCPGAAEWSGSGALSALASNDGVTSRDVRVSVDEVGIDGDSAQVAASITAIGTQASIPIELREDSDRWCISAIS